jgi:hypothetical protein
MADLRVDIASEFTGKAAFTKAQKATGSLESSVKSLGKTLGLTLGAAAMTAYGKAAVKAFAADEAAANRLATAVDNLGLSFSQAKVTDFISNLEQSAAIADDVLRPAFQGLLTTTGSLTKSQELLNNAIQISRASGVDLATVATDLGKGYVGITRGLIKYNTGLTRAEITTKSFNDILGIMLARSAGAAQDYLTTTSYKMEVLAVATGNAQETIGKGLVDAFARIGGGTEASDAAKAIDNIAKATSNVIVALGTAIGFIEKFRKGYTNFLAGGDVNAMLEGSSSTNRSASPAGTAQRTAQQRAAEATAAKRAKELAALTKKQVDSQKKLTAEQKKQAMLKKAGTIFDLDQIQILAALKGNISDEERKRLELQFALATGNTAEAQRLTFELARAQGLTVAIAKDLASLPQAANPFASWEAYLDMLMAKARAVASVGNGTNVVGTPFGQAQTNTVPGNTYTGTPFGQAGSFVDTMGTPFGQAGGNGSGYIGTPFGQSIELKITGEGDITNAIAKGLQNQSLSTGNSSTINRRSSAFGL